jgi:hypothetical protein
MKNHRYTITPAHDSGKLVALRVWDHLREMPASPFYRLTKGGKRAVARRLIGLRGLLTTPFNPSAVVTVARVNKALREAGHPETLRRGKGYYYFTGGDSAGWYTSSVYVNNVSAFTVAGWIAERNRLSTL